MAHLPHDTVAHLLESSQMIERFEDTLATDCGSGTKVSKTTRDAIVKARVDHGKFRAELLKRWDSQCSLTGLANTDLLAARAVGMVNLGAHHESAGVRSIGHPDVGKDSALQKCRPVVPKTGKERYNPITDQL